MARFDRDLGINYDEHAFVWHSPEVYFDQGMGGIKKGN